MGLDRVSAFLFVLHPAHYCPTGRQWVGSERTGATRWSDEVQYLPHSRRICLYGGSLPPCTYSSLTCTRTRCPSEKRIRADPSPRPQFVSSVAHIWSRVLSVKRILRTMPKPYVPTKAIDLPNVRHTTLSDSVNLKRGYRADVWVLYRK